MSKSPALEHVAPIEEFHDEKWDAIIAINLSAAFHATKAALPVFLCGDAAATITGSAYSIDGDWVVQ